jgi:hypothetical protein
MHARVLLSMGKESRWFIGESIYRDLSPNKFAIYGESESED